MGMFVDTKARVPVTLDGNTVYIKSKMDASTKALVEDSISASASGADQEAVMRGLGTYRLALLRYNIVDWEGPDFADDEGKKIPCNQASIGRLDLDAPLLALVAEEIGKRNAPKESPDPN
jgi:hypothetical protein